mgnify:CR=1 FL=1
MHIAQWVAIALGVLAALLTALSLLPGSHWSLRLWDFPRLQLGVVAAAAGIAYAALFFGGGALEWVFLAVTGATTLWQARKIFPYTPMAPTQVQRSTVGTVKGRAVETRRHPSFRLLITNVLMENTRHDLLLRVIEDAAPDVVLAVETDAAWARGLEPLERTYPHVLKQPQENYYGMMLFSRLPLVDARTDFLVQDDIPSMHVVLELPGGVHVYLHGIHPRPPEPIRDQDSTPRDAELVVMGKVIGDAEDRPTVVAGDLNDVAWSPTSELFIRLSGLLDPRRGRGMYNSYNAKNPLFRGIRYGNLWGYDIVAQSTNPVFIEGLKRLSQADLALDRPIGPEGDEAGEATDVRHLEGRSGRRDRAVEAGDQHDVGGQAPYAVAIGGAFESGLVRAAIGGGAVGVRRSGPSSGIESGITRRPGAGVGCLSRLSGVTGRRRSASLATTTGLYSAGASSFSSASA